MKEWSQRYPVAEPSDDWREGSWTVDCSCGVTFDDGEEMVSCDECGVWVHTRCSGYVRGEASFACHYCKAAARRLRFASGSSPSPTTPTRPRSPGSSPSSPPRSNPVCPSASASAVGPHRRCLWAGIPLEDRVHVQGVPGGDPYLFGDLSSVFSSQLWRCTGYVPKKINFRYREFPCWEEGKEGEENENPANRGADVQLSFSEKIIPCITVKKFDEDAKEEEGKILLRSCRAKGARGLQVFGQANLDRKRKEEPREAEDQGGKKKARSSPDKIVGSVPFLAMRKSKFHKDKDIQIEGAVFRGLKNGDQKEEILLESFYAGQAEAMSCSNKLKRPSFDNYTEISSVLQMKRSNTMKIRVKFEKPDRLRTVTGESNLKMNLASQGGVSDSRKESSIDQFPGCHVSGKLLAYSDLHHWQCPEERMKLWRVFRRKYKVDVMRDVICNSCENREMGRMLGQKYQQSPDDLTILASGEGGKSDPFSSFEVDKRKARYRKLHNLFSTPKQTFPLHSCYPIMMGITKATRLRVVS
ncbi:PHD [Musa troglodytarum]|uniref:PHD n=2 Tax=Musa troglodytarum TaxID=320322 RepID=A0A9E7JF77_9LILI|nr:PHD [Musa troglodytarum]